jgi:hypothetical protein
MANPLFDNGIQATPSSQTFTISPQPGGNGEGVIGLIALAPIPPPATTTPGSFLLNFLI